MNSALNQVYYSQKNQGPSNALQGPSNELQGQCRPGAELQSVTQEPCAWDVHKAVGANYQLSSNGQQMSVTERKDCLKPVLPNPSTIKVNSTQSNWDQETRVGRDCCTVTLEEKESQLPGYYQLSGYDPTYHNPKQSIGEPTHFSKHQDSTLLHSNEESKLIFSNLSNLKEINQLFARPYKGFFMGAGTRSLGNKDIETALQQGVLTNLRDKPCQVTRGTSLFRFDCLPEFGNPQRVQHVVEPPVKLGGWIRGGDNTRDHVRRVDYHRRCMNKTNNLVVHKVPKCGVTHC